MVVRKGGSAVSGFWRNAATRQSCRQHLITYRSPQFPVCLLQSHHLRRSPRLGAFRRLQSTISEAPLTASEPPPEQQPPSPSRLRQILIFTTLGVFFTTAGFLMAAQPALDGILNRLPTDEESLSLFKPSDPETAAIEAFIDSHPLTRALRADPAFTESRPHMAIPPARRPNNLTSGTLLGKDKIVVPPVAFGTRDGSRMVSLQYLGDKLCGHPGIVHGGLLATLLDEGLAMCCFPALPNKVGVTASLKVDYRKPCPANGYVVLRATTTKVEGRKAWVTGRIETLVDESKGETPEVVAEAEALFIEPRQAATMARVYSSR